MGDEKQGPDQGLESLFGWEPMFWKSRGRPVHQRTEEKANKVKSLLALEWKTQRIANALGISVPTLRKHYFSELKVRDMMRDALEAKVLQQLLAQVEKGNVGAIKMLQNKFDRLDLQRRVDEAARNDDDDVPVKALGPIGKKDHAKMKAADVLRDNPLFDPTRIN